MYIIRYYVVVVWFFVLGVALDCHGQEYTRQWSYKDRIWGSKVYYFRTGDTLLIRNYMDNNSMLLALDSLLDHPRLQGHIDSIFVKAASSPVGSPALNMRLSNARGEAVKTYIMWKHPEFSRERIMVKPVGIDWVGFQALLKEGADFPGKEKLLNLPYQTASDNDLLTMVRSISGSQVHGRLVRHIYPYLQYASVVILLDTEQTIPLSGSSALALLVENPSGTTVEPEFVQAIPIEETPVAELERTEITESEPESGAITDHSAPQVILSRLPDGRTVSYGLKTNLLYWATATSNIGFEFSPTDKWSGELWGGYQPWKLGQGSLRHWAVGAGVNYWTDKAFKGHSFGVYLLYGKYNIGELSFIPAFDGYTYQGSLSGAGLSYGYYLSVGERWGLEFSIGAGYLHLDYTKYRCVSCREIAGRSRESHFMPNKAGISLIYLLK